MQTIQHLTVAADHVGQRLDNYLRVRLKGLPKSRLYRIIRKGEVRVNRKRAEPEYKLQEGDIVRVPPLSLTTVRVDTVPDKRFTSLIEGAILFEDRDVLVINKPAGIAVHGGSGLSFGVIEILRILRPKQSYLELVHRLDRETSGCLLIAKKSSILKELHALLRENTIEKTYCALVTGHWPKALTQVDAPLYKNQLQSGERMVRIHQYGKHCLTRFRPVHYFSEATLMEIRPITGRTHQIRVHANHAQHPIIGDIKYGDKVANKRMRSLGCKRLFLHAQRLRFILPSTRQPYTLEAALPEDLQSLLNKIGSC